MEGGGGEERAAKEMRDSNFFSSESWLCSSAFDDLFPLLPSPKNSRNNKRRPPYTFSSGTLFFVLSLFLSCAQRQAEKQAGVKFVAKQRAKKSEREKRAVLSFFLSRSQALSRPPRRSKQRRHRPNRPSRRPSPTGIHKPGRIPVSFFLVGGRGGQIVRRDSTIGPTPPPPAPAHASKAAAAAHATSRRGRLLLRPPPRRAEVNGGRTFFSLDSPRPRTLGSPLQRPPPRPPHRRRARRRQTAADRGGRGWLPRGRTLRRPERALRVFFFF